MDWKEGLTEYLGINAKHALTSRFDTNQMDVFQVESDGFRLINHGKVSTKEIIDHLSSMKCRGFVDNPNGDLLAVAEPYASFFQFFVDKGFEFYYQSGVEVGHYALCYEEYGTGLVVAFDHSDTNAIIRIYETIYKPDEIEGDVWKMESTEEISFQEVDELKKWFSLIEKKIKQKSEHRETLHELAKIGLPPSSYAFTADGVLVEGKFELSYVCPLIHEGDQLFTITDLRTQPFTVEKMVMEEQKNELSGHSKSSLSLKVAMDLFKQVRFALRLET